MTTLPVQLLWTSGWDSTFRLLHLALERRVEVQPWYLNDAERLSTGFEHRAMARIREAIAARDAAAAALILPTRFVEVSEVAPHAEITARYRRWKLGSQYDWLTRFAEQEDLTGLEIGNTGQGRIYRLMEDDMERVEGAGGPTYRLIDRPANPDLLFFRRFEYPLFDVTKKDMEAIVREKGWEGLMALTWFCHSPKKGRPCGHCTPCRSVIDRGLGYRIAPLRRVRHHLSKLKRQVVGQFGQRLVPELSA